MTATGVRCMNHPNVICTGWYQLNLCWK